MEKTNRNWVSIGSINSRLIYSFLLRLLALLMLEVASKQHMQMLACRCLILHGRTIKSDVCLFNYFKGLLAWRAQTSAQYKIMATISPV